MLTRTLTLPIQEAVAYGKVNRFLNSKARNSESTKKGYTIALAHFESFLEKGTPDNLETILEPLEKKEVDKNMAYLSNATCIFFYSRGKRGI